MGKVRRAFFRVLLVLLATTPVIAVAWLKTPPYNQQQEVEAQEQAAKNQSPMSGSEAALRRTISEIQRGRGQGHLKTAQREVSALGLLQSITYLGSGKGLIPGTGGPYDRYRTIFRNGTLQWIVKPQGAVPTVVGLISEKLPTWQEWIDHYAAFPAGERATRTLTQFGVLLAAALFARLVLRIRL